MMGSSCVMCDPDLTPQDALPYSRLEPNCPCPAMASAEEVERGKNGRLGCSAGSCFHWIKMAISYASRYRDTQVPLARLFRTLLQQPLAGIGGVALAAW
jgi:hypothetical protein